MHTIKIYIFWKLILVYLIKNCISGIAPCNLNCRKLIFFIWKKKAEIHFKLTSLAYFWFPSNFSVHCGYCKMCIRISSMSKWGHHCTGFTIPVHYILPDSNGKNWGLYNPQWPSMYLCFYQNSQGAQDTFIKIRSEHTFLEY